MLLPRQARRRQSRRRRSELVDVVFLLPVSWVAENGQKNGKVDSAFSVPAPVAAAAVALGVAFRRDSEEARAHMATRALLRTGSGDCSDKFAESVDLGVDLEKLMAAERARLNGWPMAAADDGAAEMKVAAE